MFYGLAAVLMLLLTHADLGAQTRNDTLREVKVHGRHALLSNDVKINSYSPGLKIKAIDSLTLQQYQLQNMSTLLAQQEPVFIRSYGFNGLATLNLRGASAAQSQVLWNGVPIQNAALGIADVSTLPVMLMSKVNIAYGSSAALLGSGNVGGALLLESDTPVFDTGTRSGLSVAAGAGSFSQYMGGLKSFISTRRWYFSANALWQSAVNNFPFTDAAGNKKEMPGDKLKSGAVMAQLAYLIKPQNVLTLAAWYQQYDRGIPPALFETNATKTQQDGSLRLLLNWDMGKEHTTWYARSSFIRDVAHYADTAIGLVADNTTYQYFQEAGWHHEIGENSKVLLFVPVQIAWINVQNTGVIKQQAKAALAGAYEQSFFDSRLKAAINARGEAINDKAIFLPGADASFSITRWLAVRAIVQRSYRAPTLNELYYNPGGNASLKPEQGWNEEAGYTLRPQLGSVSFYNDVSVFTRDIHDWILWLGGAIWTPHNIAEVNSRGVETQNNIEWKGGKWKLHAGINTAYVLATTVSSYIANDGSLGKQIPYSPRYNGQLNIGFTFRNLYFNYNHTYTGYRFVTTDESEYLLPYQTGNIQLMYTAHVNKHSLQLSAQCNNIWSSQYQVVAYRPMPGINWLAGLRLNVL